MRNGILLILTALSLSVAASSVHAQRRLGGGPGFSMLEFSYESISPSAAEAPGLMTSPGMELEITTLEFKLNLPPLGMSGRGRDRDSDPEPDSEVLKMPGWMILHSLGYHQRRIDYQNLTSATGIDQLDRVNGMEYKMNFVAGLTRKWRTVVQLNPGLYSDLDGEIESDHWKVGAAVLVDRVFGDGFSLGMGACYTTAFGENMLLPLVHFETRPGINPHVRVLAPTLAEITWRTELGIDLGAAVRVDGGQYGLGEFVVPGGSGRIDRLRYTAITAGPFLSFRVGRGWSLMLEGGGTLHRRFETFKGDTSVDDYQLNNASFFQIGLRAGI